MRRPRIDPLLLSVLAIVLAVGWLWSRQAALPVLELGAPEVAAVSVAPDGVSAPAAADQISANADDKADPFWPPPPPAPVVTVPVKVEVAAPPPPRPSLPFQYFGQMTGPEGRLTVFAARDGELIEMRAGSVLSGEFKVERIDAQRVMFEHLPSGEKLEMPIPPPQKG